MDMEEEKIEGRISSCYFEAMHDMAIINHQNLAEKKNAQASSMQEM